MNFNKYPNGTIFSYRGKLYCLHRGAEGRILVDVDTGFWDFTHECKWKAARIVFQPDKDIPKKREYSNPDWKLSVRGVK